MRGGGRCSTRIRSLIAPRTNSEGAPGGRVVKTFGRQEMMLMAAHSVQKVVQAASRTAIKPH
jgi:hypothetical protein